ncbi:hypothetical protein [Paenibacillus naphthalenovorans]|uniref:hypothetical protein n=1 Tax=Paenibacillus naphthalenovorans TaxID=162209 RepID=UPI003D2AEC37
MFKYAQIDVETGVCVGVSILSGEVVAENMIPLTETDDVEPRDVYDMVTKTWTKAPPPAPPGPTKTDVLDAKVTQLESDNLSLMLALTDVYEQLLALQTGGTA